MTLLNVGVIGAGPRARSHLPTLLKLGDRYRLTAICDIDEARVKSAAEETGAKPYTDLEEMLSEERLDACLIAVQAEGHHIVAKALAERGIHILTETPIAITVACADQMIEASKENGVVLEVSENVPRWPHERLKQKIVADSVLGEVKGFYLSYVSGSYHGIAAIRSILRSEGESVVGRFPSEGSVLERAEITFTNRVKGIYEFNRDKGNYWEIIGTKGALRGGELHLFEGSRRFEIQMEKAEVNGRPGVVGAKVGAQPEISIRISLGRVLLDNYDEAAVADAWISLYNAVVEGRPLTYGAENARRDVELLMAIRNSASRDGVRVHLPLEGITEHEKLVHEEFTKVYGSGPLELGLRQLRVRYTLPGRLRELMYCGRTTQ